MPINADDNTYYDFEELFFEKNCDIDNIIVNFFLKYQDIRGDTEYITYKIKKLINDDRNVLMGINADGKDWLNRIGKRSFIKHYVIPEQNNGKEYYIYSINSFI
jgi:hypothetical protein